MIMETTIKSTDAQVKHALEYLATVSVFELSKIGDCASPDSLTSPGAELLDNVRINLIDLLQHDAEAVVPVAEIADSSLSVYTHTIWLQFADLRAYDEDISDYMALGSTMTQQAQFALAYLAERVIVELCGLLELEID
jgi:hypothetical protein